MSVTPVSAGLISNIGSSGKSGDIELIKNLVSSYTEKESCIILLTVSCESQSSSPCDILLSLTSAPSQQLTLRIKVLASLLGVMIRMGNGQSVRS
jgi:hypothetical protein